ncbi:MAG: hypothetical protein ACE5HO_01685 [bacterium]
MIASHIHEALAQVRELQRKILDKQRFKGYSGRARALSGTVALFAAAVMSSAIYPKTVEAHIYGWGAVFSIGFVLNYGALFHWFLFDPVVKRDFRKLRPTLEAFPALFVGGVLTLILIRVEQVQLLFGVWMCLYGLASLASRQVLPRAYWVTGAYYVCFGAGYLLTPNTSFLNPWPMGTAFFFGEWLGALILQDEGLLNYLLKMKDNRYVP